VNGPEARSCCARAYESEAARWLMMGDSFHPGGLDLTTRLGERLSLRPGQRVLDLACGRGASALHLAERFGCHVTGVDLGEANLEAARGAARARGLDELTAFQQGDAQALPFDDGAFDAVICECAFCLFPDKAAAAGEMARVLAPGGRIGFSDLVREGALPPELDGLMAWAACIADAGPLQSYLAALAGAGLQPRWSDRCDEALAATADLVRQRLFAAEVMAGLGKLAWPAFDFRAANVVARAARDAIAAGRLGYALAVASKSPMNQPSPARPMA
jgi:ubiquinone/menaquinone biosynthesis C-methylase UbiE